MSEFAPERVDAIWGEPHAPLRIATIKKRWRFLFYGGFQIKFHKNLVKIPS
jgi:hypothetical protein